MQLTLPNTKKVNLDPPFSICVNSDFFFEFASYILLLRNVDFLEMLNFVLLLVIFFVIIVFKGKKIVSVIIRPYVSYILDQ